MGFCKHGVLIVNFMNCGLCADEGRNNMANCIEADNVINEKPSRLDVLEEKVSFLEIICQRNNDTLIILLDKFRQVIKKEISEELYKNSCEKCHPKFEEDGIL